MLPTLISTLLFIASDASSQDLKPEVRDWALLPTSTNASFRGLAIGNDQSVWFSGSQGNVVRTVDGGKSFQVVSPRDSQELDFRSLVAFDAKTAIVASAGERDVILRTTDGGESWTRVYEREDQSAFFDALVFWNRNEGILMGDPQNGRVDLTTTRDQGESWQRLQETSGSQAEEGEAGFAASNAILVVREEKGLLLALGGALPGQERDSSRVLRSLDQGRSWQTSSVPMRRTESAGIFAIAGIKNHFVAVGGDFRRENATDGNVALSRDGGRTWQTPPGAPPTGYRSSIALWQSGDQIWGLAVGPNGTDITTDGGESWRRFSSTGFHVVRVDEPRQLLWACGSNGRIAQLRFAELRGNRP